MDVRKVGERKSGWVTEWLREGWGSERVTERGGVKELVIARAKEGLSAGLSE